jgi:uncharacterized protein YqjF (DUF2071 family)
MPEFWSEMSRQSSSTRVTRHRPWPLPEGPWLMAQTWRHLLFAHWEVDPELLRRVVPPQLPLDLREGSAWLGVTPFEVSGLRLRRTPPLPLASRFPELNVRTYVTLGGRPGIFFLSLDAASSLAVVAARRAYRLPYFRARMSAEVGDAVEYRSARRHGPEARFSARYAPAPGEEPGQLARWLAERYCLYTLDGDRNPLRAEIHHRPWPLQPARAEFDANTMAAPFGIPWRSEPLLHYSERQDTVIWPLRRVDEPG